MRNKIILVIVLVSLLTSSCKTSRINQTQMKLVQYALQKEDLSGQWDREEKGWGDGYGYGESYSVSYTREPFVFINHTVSLCGSEEQAKQAYIKWEDEWFSIDDFQPLTSFSPLNLDDNYRYECEEKGTDDPFPELRVCIYLQRHGRVISFVKINLDNRSTDNPTFDEMNDVLATLDKRLNEQE